MRTLALACLVLLTAVPAQAQSLGSSTNDPPVWEIHLHLQKACSSPLGQHVLKTFQTQEPDQFSNLIKFAEAIGLDPRTDIGEVCLFGDGFAEQDATVVASLGESTGNLEGWILAAPGYRSEDLDENTQLHSMNIEKKDARAWLALPKHAPTGNYLLVGSLDQNRTVELAQEVLGGNATPTPNPLQGNSILSFVVNDLSAVPMQIDENDPGAAIIKILERVAVNIASDDDQLHLTVNLTAQNAAKARQISQLLNGLKAMLQLAGEADAQKVAALLEDMAVSHAEGEADVQASMSLSYAMLQDLMKEIQN